MNNSVIALISVLISITITFSYLGFSFQSRSKNHNWRNCLSFKGKNRKYYNQEGRDSVFGLITLGLNLYCLPPSFFAPLSILILGINISLIISWILLIETSRIDDLYFSRLSAKTSIRAKLKYLFSVAFFPLIDKRLPYPYREIYHYSARFSYLSNKERNEIKAVYDMQKGNTGIFPNVNSCEDGYYDYNETFSDGEIYLFVQYTPMVRRIAKIMSSILVVD